MTAEILRVADGQVRCGRCHTQFDALERLLEEGDPNAAESGRFLQTPPQQEPQSDAIEVEEPDSMEEVTMEGKHIEISGTYRTLDDATGEAQVHQETSEEWAEVEVEAEEEVASATDPSTDQFAEPESELPIRATRAPFGSRWQQEAEPVEAIADDLPIFAVPPPPKPTPRIWMFAVLPLALLLVAQIVHHHRAELARHPSVGTPLMSVYNALGLTLTPDWNLHAYGVKQWGVVMDPAAPGTLIVRASITNGAQFAQPFPLLKLVLEDRWGDQVRAREFEPAEYLDPGVAADRLLAPAQQTNATISIVDPGPDAEGFRFDVCLRGKSGPVCAADVPAG